MLSHSVPAMPPLTTLLLVIALSFACDLSAAASVPTPGCGADDAACRAAVQEGADVEGTALSFLQTGRALQRLQPAANETLSYSEDPHGEYAGVRRLSFSHVPCNFGHTVENFGLGPNHKTGFVSMSLLAPTYDSQLWIMNHLARARGGELWGMMHPAARPISEATGCNLYYTPGKYWPAEAAKQYFGDRDIFAVLRDPYDKMVNEFRMQVQGIDSAFTALSRTEVSWREGHLERESLTYRKWYTTCDVNAYLQEELKKFLAGDRFRVNCHLLPQSEYVEKPYGATVFVDNRKFPDSLIELTKARGYKLELEETSFHNWMCNNVSAYSLTEETKRLIRKAYRSDFDLLCEQFGYCDDRELFCMENLSRMCGGKPDSSKPEPMKGS